MMAQGIALFLLEAAPRTGLFLPYLGYFLLVSFVVAVTIVAVQATEPKQIAVETLRFFRMIVLGITVFAAIVCVLEWLFVRPLL